MKQTAKAFGRVLLFLLIFCLLLEVGSFVFQPKSNRAEDGMYDVNPNGILAEPANTVDVLILGDSEADCAFIPHKIWKDYGISVYTCGLGGGNPNQSLGFLRQAYKTQSPKLVMVECNHLYGDFTAIEKVTLRLEEMIPILRYHDRWKNLRLKDFYQPVRYDMLQYQKGYHYDDRINPVDGSWYMHPSEGVRMVSENVVSCLEDMIALCEAHDTRLILVSVPSPMNWNSEKHNGMTALAERLGVAFIDMNLLQEEIPVDWQTETQDFGDHVNFSGALKVSAYTGQYLWETGLFQDKRGSWEEANWEQVIEEFTSINGLPRDFFEVKE